jgi:xanthine/CO dehydrogenase XdhC/CoxF family maturation factor
LSTNGRFRCFEYLGSESSWTVAGARCLIGIDIIANGDFPMSEWLPEIDQWKADGKRVAIATVVNVEGSAPRPVGARLAIADSGELAGSVSGGCVESAVATEAEDVLRTNTPKLIRYGITDEMAWDVGLACGGTIDVFVEPVE